jgi:AcrR family transcriptional regulator
MATSARGRARREQLIETALHAFAEHGSRGVSLATIAQLAGISEPGLIHHFPTKADLLLAVVEFYEQRNSELVDTAARASDGSLGGALLALAAQHEADPTYIRLFTVLVAESVSPEHPTHEWFVARYDRLRKSLAERFAAEQDAGLIRTDLDPHVIARQVIAVFDGIQLQFLLAGGRLDLVEPLRRLLDSFRASSSTA